MPDRESRAERLMAIRLHPTIDTHLDERGLATPAQVGAEAVRPLPRRQWCEGDAALLTVAARLGLRVDLVGVGPSAGEGGPS